MVSVVTQNPTQIDLQNRQFTGSQINPAVGLVNLLQFLQCRADFFSLSFVGVILELYKVIYEQEESPLMGQSLGV